MADRYFMINNTGSGSPQADITFRYAVSEQAQGGNANMRAQRWMNVTDLWEFPFQPGQIFTVGTPNSIHLPDYTGFAGSTWWTITGDNSPLPVTLLDFHGEKVESKVRLLWTTASEINSSHFEIERTVDNSTFKLIDRVPSKGSGSNLQYYEAWDHTPLEGLQYYYLVQYDYDNQSQSFGPVLMRFDLDGFDIVTTIQKPSERGVTIAFHYDSDEPVSFRIMDMTGRLVYAQDKYQAVPGFNNIDMDVDLARGIYQIVLQNSEKVVTRKFFY
jgi:hypothetical protein